MAVSSAAARVLVSVTLLCSLSFDASALAQTEPRLSARLRAASVLRIPRAGRAPFAPQLLDSHRDGDGWSICIVDTGVDPTHEEIGGRVRTALTLGAPPTGRAPLLEERFGGAVGAPRDDHGHGTALASIALRAAPAAEVIAVDADRGTGRFDDEDVLRGVRFCHVVADRAKLVVLLALGGHEGSHDGGSALERELDTLARRGTRIVVSAGNDGDRDVHARREDAGAVTLWIPRGAGEVLLQTRGGAPRVAHPQAGVTGRAIRIAGDPLEGGEVTIHFDGAGPHDVWITEANVAAFLDPRFVTHGDPSRTVNVPGTARDVLTVGASEDGAPASYSSIGPAADGAPKPDLVAPGEHRAALSNQVTPSDPGNVLAGQPTLFDARDGSFRARGSSFAAAHVAGVLARESVGSALFDRRRFSRTARGEIWDPHRGAGALDESALRRPLEVAQEGLVYTDTSRRWFVARSTSDELVRFGQRYAVVAGVTQGRVGERYGASCGVHPRGSMWSALVALAIVIRRRRR